ncbi:hypothetical protein GA0070216_13717 [Micromonospora matsumotoense]|uniref:VlmB-like protein n=1 Tax=Micromonospora matsumotoense TaxID=121616 RepID=A0A1C5AX13_9ACTN|nr:VlmB-like protein [Micromonospora matsumotoense]SCF49713.1 hypothetical protein GA0070216_13717 [Micromonospora matsumotoense]
MTTTTPAEAGWDTAPGLLDGAKSLTLTAEQCGLAYWLESVAQGTLAGRARTGHADGCETPEFMRAPGPLRDSLVLELAQRSVAEDKATRLLGHYVANAPGVAERDFYATQLIDEARHAQIFRDHLVELGVPADRLADTIAEVSADYTREVLDPIERYAQRVIRDDGDFIGGVAVFTIVIEGVLAPAAELSERKWERLDPPAGEIARGAAIDEIRHLTVGSSLIREHLIRHPEYRDHLLDIMRDGRRLWDELPDRRYVMAREELFQKGMADHAELLAGYEVWPGRLLLDTDPDERYDTADRWTEEMAVSRLEYMGLADALPILLGTQP